MKAPLIFLITIFSAAYYSSYAQITAIAGARKSVVARNEPFHVSYVLESPSPIEVDFAVVDDGTIKDTVSGKDISKGNTFVTGVGYTHYRVSVNRKFLPVHPGTLQLPTCQFHLKDTTLVLDGGKIQVSRKKVPKLWFKTSLYRKEGHVNVISYC